MRLVIFLSTLLSFLAELKNAASSKPPRPTISLDYAQYQGTRLPAGVDQYLGMRYAAPPLGELRFRAPREPVRASSVQDASVFGPVCVGTGQNVTEDTAEDCLFINVFTPSSATPGSDLPVWVYIQGGAYATNSNANYNGTQVIQESGHGVILVNFNYRVGALGFLAGHKVQQDGDLNVGLLDQRKALRWVKKYIHLFGGNPNHVVIHGASAGAGSVAYHLAAYGGRNDDLFIGAVAESPFWPAQRNKSESETQCSQLMEAVGCSTMSCLRSANISAIQKAQATSPDPTDPTRTTPSFWEFVPVIDGTLIQDRLYPLFAQGKFIRVPFIVGGDTNEGSYFAYNATSLADMSAFLTSLYPSLRSNQLQSINRAYQGMEPVLLHAEYFPAASAAFGDAVFTCPGIHMSTQMARSYPLGDEKVWSYRYNVQDPETLKKGLGVPHTFETEAIFGPDYGGGLSSSITNINAGIVPVVMNYYISFVKTLDPNSFRAEGTPYWMPWGTGERLKIQTNQTAMEVIPGTQQDRCALWEMLAPVMDV
ncbi:putative carboxylesterase [Aspergillus nomiae NRRL 13137]|uniref:Carboxylic ester hydrolase n=1 Tax=Aspergillus nomiae NRRL (strain ATCC 15546 / NRRL 13137 / CBS 260.88 / M93) TaxID=1509407 RepID=A0A0L1J491_ASPN3|nr:putative carboxylesterase [Aspergillus nomiae NRRL 13137]KNG86559.1 putative carboxylesterase [Aspergillus nomiae NRRL 13137]